MDKKLYVGNLACSVADADLERVFAAYGSVQSAQVIMDRDTGRSRGFGFVEMGSDQEAQAAIAALNGKDMDGRTLILIRGRRHPPPALRVPCRSCGSDSIRAFSALGVVIALFSVERCRHSIPLRRRAVVR